jgi:hypothetical protein
MGTSVIQRLSYCGHRAEINGVISLITAVKKETNPFREIEREEVEEARITPKRTVSIQFPVTLNLSNGRRFGTFASALITLPTNLPGLTESDTNTTISWTAGIMRVSDLERIYECTPV